MRWIQAFRRWLPTFLRRIPPALQWRAQRKWTVVARSAPRRVAAARLVWGGRRVRGGSGKGSASEPLVLRLANAHGTNLPELDWFAEEVAKASSGALRIEFLNHWTRPDNLREETATAFDVTREYADLGWAGTRAFGCLGVRSLDPLQAPLLLADYASVHAVCRDELMKELLEPLKQLSLIGLAVLPGALRKPFAFTRRLVDPRDYEGAKLRIHESLVAEKTYSALGAEAVLVPVEGMFGRPDLVVDGLDIQVEALAGWGFSGSIAYNVNLWPRTLALVASRKTFLWLGAAERALLLAAADRTLQRALDHLNDQEQRDLDALPARVNVVLATDEQLLRMREQVEPVYEDLRRDPETRDGLRRVEALATRSSALV